MVLVVYLGHGICLSAGMCTCTVLWQFCFCIQNHFFGGVKADHVLRAPKIEASLGKKRDAPLYRSTRPLARVTPLFLLRSLLKSFGAVRAA